ncbi:site-specific integrase [Cyanobium sp. A2C-AMD]|uniref:site-specific integrase n=1 Tax=Cyanobium sp. A2C-AMD TaxID=2823695 RepID=UPI0020CCD6BB|nr:site-specific integrase [Cyanobium sp. A2C-AMD]MCP9878053.1 site-specific integrase [Cyanobium sp. A2C-AMD]
MKKPPALRNNNGVVQVRLRIEGKEAFVNRIGRWDDPVAIAKAQAISAQIWSDVQQGTFDTTLRTYQSNPEKPDVGLLSGLMHFAHTKRQGRTIHAYRLVRDYGKTLRNKGDVEAFVCWMQERGLSNRTIEGILCECRRVCPGSKVVFTHRLKFQKRSVQSDVLGKDEIQAVLMDLKANDTWYYPLFALWLSTGLRNGEVRGLTWDCIKWSEGELLIHKALRVDGLNNHKFLWASTKTGKERIVPLNPMVLKVLEEHKNQMQASGLYDPNGLVFLTPVSHSNVYDSLLGAVFKRSLKRCGLQPRRLYAQRHTFLSHALAMGNSPADLAQVAGHSTEMLLKTYAKPTGRVLMPSWG